jgi:2-C-methyl-D-erythritol 4-phosphate cytidylyltransferase
MMNTASAIIVAAGKGLRMDDAVPKQYLTVAGIPLVGHSVLAFDNCPDVEKIYLVIPKADFEYCQKNILTQIDLHTEILLVAGGLERQDSVYNGLLAIENKKDAVVVIHDGVRPCLRPDWIPNCITGAIDYGACILGMPAHETLKRVQPNGHIKGTLERSGVWLAQTPQAFRYGLIREAHEKARQDYYHGTDDANLVERMGKEIKIIPGSRINIKVTTPEDLELASLLLERL